jgi:hypothetical protein
MITAPSLINTFYKLLSSDKKPTGCRNGDRIREMDTGTILIYNEETAEWNVFNSKVSPSSDLAGSGRVGYMVV